MPNRVRMWHLGSSKYAVVAVDWLAKMQPQDVPVYVMLCSHADRDTGECWPRIDSLAAATGKSRDSVERSLRRLEAIQAIKSKLRTAKNRRTTSLYTVLPPPEPIERTAFVTQVKALCEFVRDALDQGFRFNPKASIKNGESAATVRWSHVNRNSRAVLDNQSFANSVKAMPWLLALETIRAETRAFNAAVRATRAARMKAHKLRSRASA